MADAGWYPDPQDPRSHQYFDGQRWTGQRRPAASTAPAAPAAPAAPSAPDLAKPTPSASQTPPTFPTPPEPRTQARPGGAQAPERPYAPPAQGPQWASYQQQQRHDQPTQALPHVPYGQPGQGQPGQGQPGQPGPGGWQAPPNNAWQSPGGTAAGVPARRKRWPLFVALAAVVVLVAGALAFVFWPSSKAAPKFTYQGKEIASPGDVLTKTEASVTALVRQRHGVKANSTSCYYAQPQTPVSGQKKSDVDQSLRCGPVLFVDGDPSRSYLAVPLTSTAAGDKVTLRASSSLDAISPSALSSGLVLARPDGKTAPSGSGGLKVPSPPPVSKGLLTATSLGSTTPPSPLSNAKMIGKTTAVTVTAAGEIKRYGTGDTARSAPTGGTLVAFQVSYGAGAISGGGSARAAITVDNGAARPLPDASGDQWIIVAVPAGGQAELTFNDGGFPQSLSLPDGRPGSDNIAVLSREHRTELLTKSASVPVRVTNSNGSTNVTFRARATVAVLNFWVPRHPGRHPSDAAHALLFVDLDYTYTQANGKRYGFDPQLLRLRLPNGALVVARNVAPAGKIYNVFEVPADFTQGDLQITGSEVVQSVTVTVTKSASIPISIPAG